MTTAPPSIALEAKHPLTPRVALIRSRDTAHSRAMRSSNGVGREAAPGATVRAERRRLAPALDEVDCCGIDVVRIGRAEEVLTAFDDAKLGLGGVAEPADLVFGVPY